jgi:hypothetical protein
MKKISLKEHFKNHFRKVLSEAVPPPIQWDGNPVEITVPLPGFGEIPVSIPRPNLEINPFYRPPNPTQFPNIPPFPSDVMSPEEYQRFLQLIQQYEQLIRQYEALQQEMQDLERQLAENPDSPYARFWRNRIAAIRGQLSGYDLYVRDNFWNPIRQLFQDLFGDRGPVYKPTNLQFQDGDHRTPPGFYFEIGSQRYIYDPSTGRWYIFSTQVPSPSGYSREGWVPWNVNPNGTGYWGQLPYGYDDSGGLGTNETGDPYYGNPPTFTPIPPNMQSM